LENKSEFRDFNCASASSVAWESTCVREFEELQEHLADFTTLKGGSEGFCKHGESVGVSLMEVISRVDMSAMSEPLISPSASLLAVKMKEKPSKHDAPLCFAYQNCQLFLMSVNGNAIALEGR
jgi:hypothetical protein